LADADRVADARRASMIRAAFLHGASAIAAGALVPRPEKSPTPGLPYDKTIGLKMRVLDGPDFDLVEYRGYVVWINIFATWCPPCNAEQRDVVALAERYYERGLRVIGMDAEESDDRVRDYRKKYGIRYPITMDEDGWFSRALQVGSQRDKDVFFPGHLLFTPQGYLSYFSTGEIDMDNITSRIEGLLSLVAPSPSPGPVPTRTPGPAPTPAPHAG
jgi:thiol-disulfide isomerase/thioredoxin